MIPSTLNSETHVTKIEVENEIKTTETKKSTNNSLSPVQNSELLRQDNAKEYKRNAVIKGVNGNANVNNVQVCGKLFTSTNVYKVEMGDANIRKDGYNLKKKKAMFHPIEYWVQFQTDADVAEPFEYSPDRNSFVAKVFFITFIMLAITAAFDAFVITSEDMRELFVNTLGGKILFLGATGTMLALNYCLMCSPCMRMFPCNFIMLIVAVVCMSLITAYITASYSTVIIAYALIATAITVLVCLLLAMTSFDFTEYLLYIFAVAIAFTVLTLIVFFTSAVLGIRYQILHLILLFVGTLINVVVLIMELQMILGGKAVTLGENEYAFGAYMLYTSIVDLFLKLVQILGIFLDDGEF